MACDHNAYNRYDRVLSWSSGWILYAAAHQRVDSAALQCLHLLTVATGLASIAHWRWYRIAPLFYLDSSLASVVMGWHVFAMPSAEVLTYATLAARFLWRVVRAEVPGSNRRARLQALVLSDPPLISVLCILDGHERSWQRV